MTTNSTTKDRNAIILAAGTSSRFIPLSYERPKGLLEVKGEILIERQIRQLQEAGIYDITIITGYMSGSFAYLADKFGVSLVLNEDYARYNNPSSMIRVLDRLHNTFVCSSDNYFPHNVFMKTSDRSYYSALYASGPTKEYCMTVDQKDDITNVSIGGNDAWYMVGHVYFSEDFSKEFSRILEKEYSDENVRHGYWEDIFIKNIHNLPAMKINRYDHEDIKEFDTLDELRQFDTTYLEDTRCDIIKRLAKELRCRQSEMSDFRKINNENSMHMFSFLYNGRRYSYCVENNELNR